MGPLVVTPQLVLPDGELAWRFSRSSGPGGQSVNTSDSRVELLFDVAGSQTLPDHLRARLLDRLADRLVDGVLVVASSVERSQLANRQDARRRLVLILRAALAPPPPPRRATRPTRGSQRRRVDTKVQRGRTKALRRRPSD